MQQRALFLDRDGTINVEKEFISEPDAVELIPGAAEALRLALAHDFKLFVVSNQSGVARGLMTEADVHRVNQRLIELLGSEGIRLDGVEFCGHHPSVTGQCECRKPKRGMIDRILKKVDIDLARSIVIGDRVFDVELAYNIGAKAIMVLTGYGREELAALNSDHRPDFVADDLLGAVNWVIDHE